jgi:hypothetical protein
MKLIRKFEWNPKLRFGLWLFEEGYSIGLPFGWIGLRLPAPHPKDICDSWSISFNREAVHIHWGSWTKLFWLPWDWGANIRNEVMNEQGKLVMASDAMESVARRALIKAGVDPHLLFSIKIPDGRKMYEAEYKYTRRNGEVQVRTAKFYVGEREWRWRIFHPFAIGPKKVHRSISVEFSDEVGERTGSWKGGCTGCGYDMLPGETPLDTLRRMEKERKF